MTSISGLLAIILGILLIFLSKKKSTKSLLYIGIILIILGLIASIGLSCAQGFIDGLSGK